jgi:hypothetical protein
VEVITARPGGSDDSTVHRHVTLRVHRKGHHRQ